MWDAPGGRVCRLHTLEEKPGFLDDMRQRLARQRPKVAIVNRP